MKTTLPIASVALLLSFCAVCQASTQMAQGTIRFTGSIVESPCTTSSQLNGWRMQGCSASAREPGIEVRPINSQAAVRALDNTSVQVKRVAGSGHPGRYYDRQYVLVDNAGTPVTTGTYVITLTLP